MRKHLEKTIASSCWNKANPREMTFVLLGRDLAAADTIEFWCQRRVELGLNKADDDQIRDAMATVILMRADILAAHGQPTNAKAVANFNPADYVTDKQKGSTCSASSPSSSCSSPDNIAGPGAGSDCTTGTTPAGTADAAESATSCSDSTESAANAATP